MKIPQITVLDELGAAIWDGSLLTFARDNAFDYEQTHELCNQLRPTSDGKLEPAFIGGGAAPEFMVLVQS
ncbi:MAG TPA: hypothetical protein VJA26_02780 [Gammaproteobacteria bacterium]|nr:hypothetical protein [Gammaproteobacteria bacterium]